MASLTEQITERLQREILAGRLDTRAELITERKLCKRLGVSRVTMRRALWELLERNLLRSIPNKGYVLGPAALGAPSRPSGKSKRRDRILVVRAPAQQAPAGNVHERHIYRGMEEEARAQGLTLEHGVMTLPVLQKSLDERAREKLLGVALYWNHREAAEALLAGGVPLVLVEGIQPSLPVDAVVQDDEGGVENAVRYLWAKGHRRIALISWGESDPTPLRRRGAFRGALIRRGIVDPGIVGLSLRLDAAGGREAAAEVLDRDPPPTAFLVGFQRMLPGVLEELEARRLHERIALVAWGERSSHRDLLQATPWENRRFDRVAWSREQMGRVAVRTLLARARDPMHPPMKIRLPVELFAADQDDVEETPNPKD